MLSQDVSSCVNEGPWGQAWRITQFFSVSRKMPCFRLFPPFSAESGKSTAAAPWVGTEKWWDSFTWFMGSQLATKTVPEPRHGPAPFSFGQSWIELPFLLFLQHVCFLPFWDRDRLRKGSDSSGRFPPPSFRPFLYWHLFNTLSTTRVWVVFPLTSEPLSGFYIPIYGVDPFCG